MTRKFLDSCFSRILQDIWQERIEPVCHSVISKILLQQGSLNNEMRWKYDLQRGSLLKARKKKLVLHSLASTRNSSLYSREHLLRPSFPVHFWQFWLLLFSHSKWWPLLRYSNSLVSDFLNRPDATLRISLFHRGS